MDELDLIKTNCTGQSVYVGRLLDVLNFTKGQICSSSVSIGCGADTFLHFLPEQHFIPFQAQLESSIPQKREYIKASSGFHLRMIATVKSCFFAHSLSCLFHNQINRGATL